MFFSRVLQNLQKIKYTNNNLYNKHNYDHYKLTQHKIRSVIGSKNQSILTHYRYSLPKGIIKSRNIEHIENKEHIENINNIDKKNKTRQSIIMFMIGTTTILVVSVGSYSYIVIKHLLVCL